jgi:hypothetical protein
MHWLPFIYEFSSENLHYKINNEVEQVPKISMEYRKLYILNQTTAFSQITFKSIN